MADKLRFGIVGLGLGRSRSKMCSETEGAELVAVCDTWEDRLNAIREELDVEIERDFERFIKRDDIDVVGIWTPSGMHASMAIKALEAGKHVCMTKPMDIRTSICDEAIRKADEKGLVLAVDFDSRYVPSNHQIHDAVKSGTLGKIMLGDLRMKWFRGQSYYDSGMEGKNGWRSKLETEGGSLANQAVHYLDLLQWWLGPVVRVIGKKSTFAHDIETEDGTVALLETESGAYVTVLTTTCSFPNLGTSIDISGTDGTLSWKNQKIELFQVMSESAAGSGDGAYIPPEKRTKFEPVDLSIDKFKVPENLPKNIFEDMVGAVRDGRKVMCDGREGRKSVAVFEAVYASSDKEVWLDV